MRIEKLPYEDDLVAQELFELAGRALANPGDGETRRTFWKFVDESEHEWIGTLVRGAQASHPRGLDDGKALFRMAIEDAYGVRYAGQPAWLRGVFQAFE